MTRKELPDQMDHIIKQLIADTSPPDIDQTERAGDMCSVFEGWVIEQTERLAAQKSVSLWVDKEEARRVGAVRSRN